MAAHLRSLGVEPRVFGEPMEFWRHQMPRGMLLRSSKRASSISGPNGTLRLDDYSVASGVKVSEAIPVEDFTEYGRWFQQQAVQHIDPRKVSRVEAGPSGFRLLLQDGEPVDAARVVVAVGIGRFAHRPAQFVNLPSALASHSSEHSDLAKFAGMRVTVVGAGQSAFESAALLFECGAEVELLVRARGIRWLASGRSRLHLGRIHSLLYAPTDVGPIGFNQIIARPRLFRLARPALQKHMTYTAVRPMVSSWLKPRLSGVRISTSRSIVSAIAAADGLHLELDDGSTRHADHILLGTGFRIDLSRYGFLAPGLLESIATADGYPRLGTGFESSVAGLFFAGAPATHSFGPLFRFVAGTEYCAKAIAGTIKSDIEAKARNQITTNSNNRNHRATPAATAFASDESLDAR